MTYVKPTVFANSFTCPHSDCGVISKQDWIARMWNFSHHPHDEHNHLRVAMCHHCKKTSVWVDDQLFYPITTTASAPNGEMPATVLKLYQEAATIAERSPRGAAALLRLSIQVLCKELGEPGTNINSDIASLVTKGLPSLVQKSLDVVRVTGNDAVHPGQIDTDDPETVKRLFELVNIIVEYMIALPKQVSGLYSALPADKLKGIADRDKPKP